MMEPIQSCGRVLKEGMILHIFDNDHFTLACNRVRQPIGSRLGPGLVARSICIQCRAKGEFVILVQENIYIAGVVDQAHGFRDHGIQHIWQVEAGGEIDAQFLERIQFIGLLFEHGKQSLIVDQFPGNILYNVVIHWGNIFPGQRSEYRAV